MTTDDWSAGSGDGSGWSEVPGGGYGGPSSDAPELPLEDDSGGGGPEHFPNATDEAPGPGLGAEFGGDDDLGPSWSPSPDAPANEEWGQQQGDDSGWSPDDQPSASDREAAQQIVEEAAGEIRRLYDELNPPAQ
jgi:hypothetical protein